MTLYASTKAIAGSLQLGTNCLSYMTVPASKTAKVSMARLKHKGRAKAAEGSLGRSSHSSAGVGYLLRVGDGAGHAKRASNRIRSMIGAGWDFLVDRVFWVPP